MSISAAWEKYETRLRQLVAEGQSQITQPMEAVDLLSAILRQDDVPYEVRKILASVLMRVCLEPDAHVDVAISVAREALTHINTAIESIQTVMDGPTSVLLWSVSGLNQSSAEPPASPALVGLQSAIIQRRTARSEVSDDVDVRLITAADTAAEELADILAPVDLVTGEVLSSSDVQRVLNRVYLAFEASDRVAKYPDNFRAARLVRSASSAVTDGMVSTINSLLERIRREEQDIEMAALAAVASYRSTLATLAAYENPLGTLLHPAVRVTPLEGEPLAQVLLQPVPKNPLFGWGTVSHTVTVSDGTITLGPSDPVAFDAYGPYRKTRILGVGTIQPESTIVVSGVRPTTQVLSVMYNVDVAASQVSLSNSTELGASFSFRVGEGTSYYRVSVTQDAGDVYDVVSVIDEDSVSGTQVEATVDDLTSVEGQSAYKVVSVTSFSTDSYPIGLLNEASIGDVTFTIQSGYGETYSGAWTPGGDFAPRSIDTDTSIECDYGSTWSITFSLDDVGSNWALQTPVLEESLSDLAGKRVALESVNGAGEWSSVAVTEVSQVLPGKILVLDPPVPDDPGAAYLFVVSAEDDTDVASLIDVSVTGFATTQSTVVTSSGSLHAVDYVSGTRASVYPPMPATASIAKGYNVQPNDVLVSESSCLRVVSVNQNGLVCAVLSGEAPEDGGTISGVWCGPGAEYTDWFQILTDEGDPLPLRNIALAAVEKMGEQVGSESGALEVTVPGRGTSPLMSHTQSIVSVPAAPVRSISTPIPATIDFPRSTYRNFTGVSELEPFVNPDGTIARRSPIGGGSVVDLSTGVKVGFEYGLTPSSESTEVARVTRPTRGIDGTIVKDGSVRWPWLAKAVWLHRTRSATTPFNLDELRADLGTARRALGTDAVYLSDGVLDVDIDGVNATIATSASAASLLGSGFGIPEVSVRIRLKSVDEVSEGVYAVVLYPSVRDVASMHEGSVSVSLYRDSISSAWGTCVAVLASLLRAKEGCNVLMSAPGTDWVNVALGELSAAGFSEIARSVRRGEWSSIAQTRDGIVSDSDLARSLEDLIQATLENP